MFNVEDYNIVFLLKRYLCRVLIEMKNWKSILLKVSLLVIVAIVLLTA